MCIFAVYLDVNECAEYTLAFNVAFAATRQYEIKTTQYICNDENAGPPGCLQYHMGSTGNFARFVQNCACHLDAVSYVFLCLAASTFLLIKRHLGLQVHH